MIGRLSEGIAVLFSFMTNCHLNTVLNCAFLFAEVCATALCVKIKLCEKLCENQLEYTSDSKETSLLQVRTYCLPEVTWKQVG